MGAKNIKGDQSKYTVFINLGGFVILIGLLIHIIANMVLKTFPPADLNFIELQNYLSHEANTWAIVHGLRYVAIVCIVIFSCGLFVKTSIVPASSIGWALVGMFGSILMMANLLITNGIEILAFFDFHKLSEQTELFWLLFYLTRVLFTGEIVTWGLLIFGFSMAGLHSHTIPKWIGILGIASASTCLLSAFFIISVLREGWASILIEIASLSGLTWFICVGIFMLPKMRLKLLK